jgi:hypothetical protein
MGLGSLPLAKSGAVWPFWLSGIRRLLWRSGAITFKAMTIKNKPRAFLVDLFF